MVAGLGFARASGVYVAGAIALPDIASRLLILDALNFTLAGAREGFGPFLGVYLQQAGFDPARTGFAMSLAGLAGIAATMPLGALIDGITAKRSALVLAVAAVAVGAALVVATHRLWVIAVGQVVIGAADAGIAPLVAALTLGLVGRERYGDRVARNEVFNHAGNAARAALAAILGYAFGLGYVAAAIAAMAVAASLVVGRIDPREIDHGAARGGDPAGVSAVGALRGSRPLLVLAVTVFLFQTANGAMLPFIAQALVKNGHDPSLTTGAMTVASQASMVAAAALVPRLFRTIGGGRVLAVALALVAIRAGVAASGGNLWSIAFVQFLEGLAMGFAGVAIPALVAEIMSGSGHSSAGLGGVMTAYGAGAALSPILAGLVAQSLGFPAAFLGLGTVALLGLAAWTILGRRRATSDVGASRPADRAA